MARPRRLRINSKTASDMLTVFAAHEAGHVVTALYFGIPVTRVEVLQEAGEAGGFTHLERGHELHPGMAIIDAAGDVAAKLAAPFELAALQETDPAKVRKIMDRLPIVDRGEPITHDASALRLAAAVAVGGAPRPDELADFLTSVRWEAEKLLRWLAPELGYLTAELKRKRVLTGPDLAWMFLDRSYWMRPYPGSLHAVGGGAGEQNPSPALPAPVTLATQEPAVANAITAPSTTEAARSGPEWQGGKNERKSLSRIELTGPSMGGTVACGGKTASFHA